MRPSSLIVRALTFTVAMAVAHASDGQTAQPPAEPKLGHSNNSELGLVIAAGNAQSTSVGLRNVYLHRWTNAEFKWEVGWLRATSRDGDRYVVQQDAGFEVIDPETAVDSARLFSKVSYQRQLTPRHDWFANADMVRDEPANITRQFVFAGGLGTTWFKTERLTFRTAYGASYADEELVVEGANRFAGYRLAYDLEIPLAATSRIDSELTADGSFETGDDIRTDWLNSLTVAINSRLALKSSIRVLFRNLPALETVDLRSPTGVVVGSVDIEKKKVDTNLTTSLVITF